MDAKTTYFGTRGDTKIKKSQKNDHRKKHLKKNEKKEPKINLKDLYQPQSRHHVVFFFILISQLYR